MQVTIEKIISLLNTSTQSRLIDNFETPYNVLSGTQKQVEDVLRRLHVEPRRNSRPCGEDILHARRLSNGSRGTSDLPMKQRAFVSTRRSFIVTAI